MPDQGGALAAIRAAWDGAALMFGAGLIGRLMWHSGEVQRGRRRFLSWELVWEMPVAAGMTLIGLGVSDYLGLGVMPTAAIVSTATYLGPRGLEVIAARVLASRAR